MKAVFSINYNDEYIEKIKNLGYEVVIRKGELEESDYDCHVLHCFKTLKSENISKFKNLKLLQLPSIGFEHLPKEDLLKSNIIVSNQKGIYSKPIGEWIVFNILQILKNSKKIYENQKSHTWKYIKGIDELEDKVILFLGTGTIAIEAVNRLKGFGVKLIGLNSNGRNIERFDECYKLLDIDKHSKYADFIINVLPSTPKTKNYINSKRINNFKRGVNFINVSRGDVVNKKDLIFALNNKLITNACIDVVENEPLDKNSPFWDIENLYLSPHISWTSSKREQRVFANLYTNMKNLLESKPLINVVNLNKGY